MNKGYERVIDRLIEAMEGGIIPWKRPWMTPTNAISNKPYRGINYLMLASADFADPRYITFLQARDMGGWIKKGATGYPIIKWIFPSAEDRLKNPNSRPYVRCFTVFNVEQCENLVKLPARISLEKNPIAEAQAIIDNWTDKPDLDFGGFQAFYSVILDKIYIPEIEKFDSFENFYDVLFHEYVHSTGHVSRLNRDLAPWFLAEEYGLEELTAEIGGALLCGQCGIDNSNLINNSAAYLQSWLQAVKNDPDMLIKAASRAARASDLIMGRLENAAESTEPEETALMQAA